MPELEIIDANHQDLAKICQSLDVKVAFSGLPSGIAKSVEKMLTDGGIKVFSNASSYRRVKGIPMIIPKSTLTISTTVYTIVQQIAH